MGSPPDDEATIPRGSGDESSEGDTAKPAAAADLTQPLAASALDPDPTPLPARFEPRGVIGRGGMGRVLRVLDRSLNREVAVKLLRAHYDPDARVRFLREARAAGTLRHPNIVTVYDVAPEGEYLVLELVEGESLGSRIKREGRLPVAEVRRIGAALLGALAAAHREGIIHRDVKPANILLDAADTVKLTDFGIASFGDSELTSTGQLMGTPAYMAPEQLRARRVDERADIYGAGATLFEAATGIRLNNKEEQVADPRQAVIDATGDAALASAIARAVREKETERFPDAGEFAAALALQVAAAPARWRWYLAIGGVAVAVGITAAVVSARGDKPLGVAASVPARVTTIAMLPFADHVGDVRLDFAVSGLPHLLGEELGHVDRIRVLGYYRVRGRVANPDDPSSWLEAARALGADVVLRGQIEPDAGQVQVSIFIERSDGTRLGRFDRAATVDRIPEAVQTLAPLVAGAVLGGPSKLQPGTAHGFELERELQLGVAAFERQDFDGARGHLSAAVSQDDSLGEAHYYLAMLDWWQAIPPAKDLERALAGSLAPLDRDFLVGLRLLVAIDYPRALDYFRALARRAPEHRDIQYGLFEAQYHGGYPSEAVETYRRLRELAPGFYVGAEHAMMYYLARGDAAGIAWTREHWELPPAKQPIWAARAAMARQDYGEALRVLERASEEQPGTGESIRRDLIATYAVTGQLALARQTNARLISDPGYRALADYGLAVAGGEDVRGWRTRASQAVAAGIPGLKQWEGWLELVFLDQAIGTRQFLHEDLGDQTGADPNIGAALGSVLLGAALHDVTPVTTVFPQVASLAAAVAADARKDPRAAAISWREVADRDADGRLRGYASYALARDLEAVGDHAGVIAACDEVITPRVFSWSWAATVGPCLRWSAEAAAPLGRGDDANRRWQRLLALRSAAPPDDALAQAARKALGK